MPALVCPSGCTGQWRPFRQVRSYALYRCCACGVVTWDFSGVDLLAIYRSGYFESADPSVGYDQYRVLDAAIRLNGRARLRRMLRHARRAGGRLATGPGGRRLLEVGCAHGFYLDEARRAGLVVSGIEPAEEAAREARERLGLDVTTGGYEDAAGGPPVDAVVLWDVIEHVADPRGLLAWCRERLAPHGSLVLTTGDIDSLAARLSGAAWHLYNLPEHVCFFTPASLAGLLRQLGFERIRVRHPPLRFPLGYLERRLARTARPRWLWRRLRLPGALRRLVLPVNLWDVMEVHALKAAG